MPEEIYDMVIAERLEVTTRELLAMDIDELDGRLAYLRGREIAMCSEPPGRRGNGDLSHRR